MAIKLWKYSSVTSGVELMFMYKPGALWCFMCVLKLFWLEYFFPQIPHRNSGALYPGGPWFFSWWTLSSLGVKNRLGHCSQAWSLALLWVRLMCVVSLWRRLNSFPQKHLRISGFSSCSVFMWFFKLSCRVKVAGHNEHRICSLNSFAICLAMWVERLHLRKDPNPQISQKNLLSL